MDNAQPQEEFYKLNDVIKYDIQNNGWYTQSLTEHKLLLSSVYTKKKLSLPFDHMDNINNALFWPYGVTVLE